MKKQPGPELLDLIGEEAMVRLAEAFGGTRLYVPPRMTPDHEIVAAIGPVAAALLAERMAPDVIRVPLAREARARHYRASGKSNSQIARALGITETGVNLLFKRMKQVPAKNSGSWVERADDTDQLRLFD